MKIWKIVFNVVPIILFVQSTHTAQLVEGLSALKRLAQTYVVKPCTSAVRKNPIKVIGGTTFGSWITYQNIKAYKKECFYIEDVNDLIQGKKIPTVNAVIAERSKNPVNLYNSQTYQSVYALLGEKPKKDIRPDEQYPLYREAIDKVICRYYGTGLIVGVIPPNKKTRKQLTEAVVLTSDNEARAHTFHNSFIHGTASIEQIIARTAHYQPTSHFFMLREPGATKELTTIADPTTVINITPTWAEKTPSTPFETARIQELNEARMATAKRTGKRIEMHDQHPWAQTHFLSANPSAVSASKPVAYNGENSLVFLTEAGEGGIDAQPGHALVSTPIAIAFNDIDCASGIVQILVPKPIVKKGRIYSAVPYGVKAGDNLAEDLQALQEGRKVEIDDMQVRIPLDPEYFENPTSGIRMNAIVYASQEKLDEIVQGLKNA